MRATSLSKSAMGRVCVCVNLCGWKVPIETELTQYIEDEEDDNQGLGGCCRGEAD